MIFDGNILFVTLYEGETTTKLQFADDLILVTASKYKIRNGV